MFDTLSSPVEPHLCKCGMAAAAHEKGPGSDHSGPSSPSGAPPDQGGETQDAEASGARVQVQQTMLTKLIMLVIIVAQHRNVQRKMENKTFDSSLTRGERRIEGVG
jgi:hypothetical protein